MTTAQDRGWGDCGVPDPTRQQRYALENVVPVSIAGVTWKVHRLVVPVFRHLLEQFVVPTIGPITKVADDWSYAPRCIRGTGPGTGKPCVVSNHAWGLAIDVNATQNPMGGDRHGQFPPDFGQRIAHLKLRWGGDYTSRTDPMHFEFIGTPLDARRIAAALTDQPTQQEDDMTKDEHDALMAVAARVEVIARVQAAQGLELDTIKTRSKVIIDGNPTTPGLRQISAAVAQVSAGGFVGGTFSVTVAPKE